MGEILNFPRDNLRRALFVQESTEHQAKLEIRTFMWIVEKYTLPGETIIDPMSGIGTVHMAATVGRNTIAMELSPRFVELQRLNIVKINEVEGINANTMVMEGDCRRFLPVARTLVNGIATQRHSIIFSPPYGDLWKKSKTEQSDFMKEKHINIGYDLQDANVGNISNYPLYLNAMKAIYTLCNQSLVVGEFMVIVVKDYVKQGKRIYCTKDNIRMAFESGFTCIDWHERYSDPKVFQIRARELRAAKGDVYKPELDIDFEDVVVLEKITNAI